MVAIIVFFILRTYKQYEMFKNHENFFRQNRPPIESWMTVELLIDRFHIPPEIVLDELHINYTVSTQRSTIDSICKKNNLNCTEVVNDLNNIQK